MANVSDSLRQSLQLTKATTPPPTVPASSQSGVEKRPNSKMAANEASATQYLNELLDIYNNQPMTYADEEAIAGLSPPADYDDGGGGSGGELGVSGNYNVVVEDESENADDDEVGSLEYDPYANYDDLVLQRKIQERRERGAADARHAHDDDEDIRSGSGDAAERVPVSAKQILKQTLDSGDYKIVSGGSSIDPNDIKLDGDDADDQQSSDTLVIRKENNQQVSFLQFKLYAP